VSFITDLETLQMFLQNTGTTYSLTQPHIPEDQNLLILMLLNSRYAYWLRLLGFVQLFTLTILQKLALFQFTSLSFQVKDTLKPWFQRFIHLMTEILKTQWSFMTERINSRTLVLHKGMVYWGCQSGMFCFV